MREDGNIQHNQEVGHFPTPSGDDDDDDGGDDDGVVEKMMKF